MERVKFEETKCGSSSYVPRCAESASSCKRFAPKPTDAALLVQSDPGESASGKKGKSKATFTHRKATCTSEHVNMSLPLIFSTKFEKSTSKVHSFCFVVVIMLHQDTFLHGAIGVLMLFFGKHCSAMAISSWVFSCWMLVLYIRRDGKRPSVVFLHSAWRPWRWQSSAANASQRAGFYRQLSKIFMSAARAQLKRRIFCATIRERWAFSSSSCRLRSSVTLFSDDFAA